MKKVLAAAVIMIAFVAGSVAFFDPSTTVQGVAEGVPIGLSITNGI